MREYNKENLLKLLTEDGIESVRHFDVEERPAEMSTLPSSGDARPLSELYPQNVFTHGQNVHVSSLCLKFFISALTT